MTLVRLEPAALRSRVKHSTTEPLRSHVCPLYDEARYTLMKRLREQLGIHAPNIYTLLGYDSPAEFPNWRELICEEVGGYIERTERFKETKDQKLASP